MHFKSLIENKRGKNISSRNIKQKPYGEEFDKTTPKRVTPVATKKVKNQNSSY